MNFEAIIKRMLDAVPNRYDKREGGMIYNALAPAALELAKLYADLAYYDGITYADLATGESLTKRCAERGVNRKAATCALRLGVFNTAIPLGSRFGINGVNYKVAQLIDPQNYELVCEQSGEVGNRYSGNLLPIDYIQGLETAELTDILTPGEDLEGDQSLRERYFANLESQAFGGNITDYLEKTNVIDGVGGAKVYPLWNGGGTVKLVIIDSSFNKPSAKLIDDVQTAIDPTVNGGAGYGIAPIGHVVTVEGVSEIMVSVGVRITFQTGYAWADIKPLLEVTFNDYLAQLRSEWAKSDGLIIRTAYLDARALGVAGVLDITDTTINGLAQNLVLGADQVPRLGEVSQL